MVLYLNNARVQSGLEAGGQQVLPELVLDERLVDLAAKSIDENSGEEVLTFNLALSVTVRGKEARRAQRTWEHDACEALCLEG
jgi:hypothetical protein